MSKESFDSSLTAGHRERLRQKFLDDKLANYEVLELFLTYAIPRVDVRPLSRRLYNRFGGTFQILSASLQDLCSVPGMGRNTAIIIKAMQKIMLDGYRDYFKQEPMFFNKRAQFENYCKLELGGHDVEEMHIIHMDDQGKLLEDQVHSVGTNDETPFYTREIIKHALDIQTKYIAFVHNHPRPNTGFSKQDVEITREAMKQLETMGIGFIDHYLVSGGILYSMRENHWLDKSGVEKSDSVSTDISGTSGISEPGTWTAPES